MTHIETESFPGITIAEVLKRKTNLWITLAEGNKLLISSLLSPGTRSILIERPTSHQERTAFLTSLEIIAQAVVNSQINCYDMEILPSSVFAERTNSLVYGGTERLQITIPQSTNTTNILIFSSPFKQFSIETIAYQFFDRVADMYEMTRKFSFSRVLVGMPQNKAVGASLLGGAEFGLRLGFPSNRVHALGLIYPDSALDIIQ